MDEPVTVHAATGIPWQKRYLAAIIAGFELMGIPARHEGGQSTASPGVHIILGPNVFKNCFNGLRIDGRDCLTINRAFIGSVLGDEANPYVAIGWNGYNNRARFPFEFGDELPHSRMTEQLWAEVYAQVSDRPGLPLILGEYENTSGYLAAAVTQCKSRGGGSFYRPHPHGPTPSSVHPAPWTLIEDSIDASSVCLTHHSTAGVMALIRGCPVISYDRESMTWPITPHELGATIPDLPERADWLEWLAWTQWTIDEIARGDPWEFYT